MDLPKIALSIRQPWAWLVANDYKDIENRSWATNFRGDFLIHAGKAFGRDEREVVEDLRAGLNPATFGPLGGDVRQPEVYELGGIIGVAKLVDCVDASPSPWFVGDFGFVIVNARPLPFMPLKGALGFFAAEYSEIA